MKARSKAGKPTPLPGVTVLAGALSVCASLFALAGGAAASIPQSAVFDVQIQGAVNGLPFVRAGNMALGARLDSVPVQDTTAALRAAI